MGAPLVVVGAAGTGRETLDLVSAVNADRTAYDLLGVIDDSPGVNVQRLEERNIEYLGGIDEFLDRHNSTVHFLVAIAWPRVRKLIAERLEAVGHRPATIVHPQAIVGSRVRLGPGSIVYGGVHISTNVTVGRSAILNAQSCIGHDSVLGDYVSVNPGARISGDVSCGDEVLIGSNATILQGLRVGSYTTVGAAALLTKNAPGGVTVKGVPGRW